MKQYSLDQLSHVATRKFDARRWTKELNEFGIDEDASFAILTSDALRKQDLVRFAWEYGGEYWEAIEAYVDAVLACEASNLPGPDDSRPGYTLGELAWVHATGLFSYDMAIAMVALGTPPALAAALSRSAGTHHNVLKLWTEFSDSCSAEICRYLAKCLESYPPGWPHQPVAKPRP